MNASSTAPFEEYPYYAFPIARTAPRRLAVASLLHDGPRTRTAGARVLELVCANGANLLPMAFYRPDCEFVGIDGSGRQIATAEAGREREMREPVTSAYHDIQAVETELQSEARPA